MPDLGALMLEHGWTATTETSWERSVPGTFAIALVRYDGSLTVFAATRGAGGSLSVPAHFSPEEKARSATRFAE